MNPEVKPEDDDRLVDFAEPVLSATAMRAADAYASSEVGIPTFTLMEVAGRSAVSAAVARYGSFRGRRVAILCGKGNNGGDGLVMARVFLSMGASVAVLLPDSRDVMTDDAARNLRILELLAEHTAPDRLLLLTRDARDSEPLASADLYVDALLGTGLSQTLREPTRGLVAWLNTRRAPIVAVDVPTGLDADTGEILGDAVRADLTVTMGALKPGLLLRQGPGCSGKVVVAEIGIPRHTLVRGATASGSCFRTTDDLIGALLPRRDTSSHKYSVGLALVVGGSPGLTGAPVMASTAAARVGAGAVVCACHADVQSTLASRMTEIMTLGLPTGSDGGLDPDAAVDALSPRLNQARALLVGCGLGRAPGTAAFVRKLSTSTSLPLVIDADGLNAFSGHTQLFTDHANGRWVLTPHAGEFARLADDARVRNPIETVRSWARRWNCILVLKGMPSVVGTPGGRVYLCGTGNPALATAGTGDVLAGMIAGFLAQGLQPEHATVCGLHVGGACADSYASQRSGRSMQATDLIRELPIVLAERFEHAR